MLTSVHCSRSPFSRICGQPIRPMSVAPRTGPRLCARLSHQPEKKWLTHAQRRPGTPGTDYQWTRPRWTRGGARHGRAALITSLMSLAARLGGAFPHLPASLGQSFADSRLNRAQSGAHRAAGVTFAHGSTICPRKSGRAVHKGATNAAANLAGDAAGGRRWALRVGAVGSQQMRGSCSPIGVSTTRVAPKAVFVTTMPGWSSTHSPITAASEPSG
jgi:hypothetical protein